MPPAAGLPPGPAPPGGPGEMISPGPPQCRHAAFGRRVASSEGRMAGLWASGVSAFESEKNEKAAPGNCRLKARGRAARDAACPVCKSLWKERDGGLGKGEGSFSSEKFPLPSPSFRYLLNTLPMPRMPASSKSLPMSCIPTGRPSASPTGNERPGSPARFRDTV